MGPFTATATLSSSGFPKEASVALWRPTCVDLPWNPCIWYSTGAVWWCSAELHRQQKPQPMFLPNTLLVFITRTGWWSRQKGSVQENVSHPPPCCTFALVWSPNSPCGCVFIFKALLRNETNWIMPNHSEFSTQLIHKTNGRALPLDLLILWRGAITQRSSTRQRLSLSAFKPFDEFN